MLISDARVKKINFLHCACTIVAWSAVHCETLFLLYGLHARMHKRLHQFNFRTPFRQFTVMRFQAIKVLNFRLLIDVFMHVMKTTRSA